MRRAALLAALLVVALPAQAGNQDEERLADSVRASLQSAIADRAVPVLLFKGGPDSAYRWLSEMSKRLEQRIPDRKQRIELLKTVQYEATRAGLDPQLVLGVMQVESGFKKYAVSAAGARGYMQVMPFWIRLIGEKHHNLFALRTNLRYGCVILRFYLDREQGDFFRALGRYNGSLGQADYPNLVHSAWKRTWSYDGATS
jgi:soluble lytic murein transglycosylase-like protein